MKKVIICGLMAVGCGLGIGAANAALPLTGFYKTIDDEVKKPKSIVRLYECGENLCGRIVALYDVESGQISETLAKPVRIADKVEGAPKMVGLDILWNMKWDADDSEYSDGKIMDPKKGSVYSSVIWADKNDASLLNVRGKIGPFGRTQVWHVMDAKDLPKDLQKLDTGKWTPNIIK
jgi:uncharacterized protein (DUF2147 family)